ncbi:MULTISPECIES: sigma-Y antisigma factor component [Mesobacillus]|uniref:Sigma-Y antisigma factor component n=1 Tax=Mesobacillus selenatarsenatis TaxID=388741 RepID=A0A846TN86_9BACI|nr:MULTISPECIES: sigma-Y antisigma factor component [Mesobacillus]NKE05615.1 sigma-Y antisigma factor component [Mesobacillus selenatarsenatis]
MNEELSPVLLALVVLILLAQSIFLFTNARKHGHNYWLWGILGLIQAPMPLLFYLLFARKIWRR